jgi:hypothetical protein
MEAEMGLLFKVITHLVKRERVLAVLFRPERTPGEDPAAYLERVETERVLALAAGYNPDE